MEQKTKRGVKIAVGIGCFVVVMAIISIVVAAALAGQTKPELYDKRYYFVDNKMYDGAVIAVYDGDYVLVRDNAVLTRRYRYLRYSHEDLFFFCADKDAYGLVSSRGREVRTFGYSDRPLYKLSGTVSPYYIVPGEGGDYVMGIDGSRSGPYQRIAPLGSSEAFSEAGAFTYVQDGKTFAAGAKSGNAIDMSGHTSRVSDEFIILTSSDGSSRAYSTLLEPIAGSENAALWTNGNHQSGEKLIYQNNGVFILELTGENCIVTDVADNTRTVVPLPAGWTNFSGVSGFAVEHHADGQFILHFSVSGTAHRYFCKEGVATALESYSAGSIKDDEGDKHDYLICKSGDAWTVWLDGAKAGVYGEKTGYARLYVKATDSYREYIRAGGTLYGVKADLSLESVVEGVRETDSELIIAEDAIYDGTGKKLGEGTDTVVYGDGLFRYTDADGKYVYRLTGSGYSMTTDRDLLPIIGTYGAKTPQPAWIFTEKDNAAAVRFYDKKGRVILDETHAHYDEIKAQTYTVRFFGGDDFIIEFAEGQTFSSRTGDFLWYGAYKSFHFSRDGKTLVASDGKGLTTYRYITGRYREQNSRWFYAGVTVSCDDSGSRAAMAKYGFVYTDKGTGGKGFINMDGDFVTPASYAAVTIGSKLVTVRYQNGTAAVLDTRGKTLQSGDYSNVYLLGEYAVLQDRVGELHSLVNTNGKVILSDIWSVSELGMFEYNADTQSYETSDSDFKYYAIYVGGSFRILKMPILY